MFAEFNANKKRANICSPNNSQDIKNKGSTVKGIHVEQTGAQRNNGDPSWDQS
ncbi:hypothetical protein C427_4098 [Paraglaciecola psychrophila 170]|uniref:Uncharacterized protein n=1 Tax=Paraglaciecola psychrophila 170 TaxID=1129794 RepID=M4RU66_9ALTE|nr:hypothetical protein C427_4098 [Paraglaciecola psychrophila 170]